MRCLFLDGLSEHERSEIDGFDQACRAVFAEFATGARGSAPELEKLLLTLDPEFQLLKVDAPTAGTRSIELRASDLAAKPRLRRFASLAPPGVVVHTSARPRALEDVSGDIETATGRSLAGARVRAGFGRGHLLDLLIHLERVSTSQDALALSTAERAVYGLLGDELTDDWIGRIDVAPLPRPGPLKLLGSASEMEHTFSLGLLKATVENAVRRLYEGLGQGQDAPRADSGEWTLLEASPEQDALGQAQGDLLYASTCLPEMLKCFLEGAAFSSCRFSAMGERFCYLKYRHAGDAQLRVAERQALEDTIDQTLGEKALGRVVGNGIGTNHSYVDLALIDVPAALGSLRRLGRKRNLPLASWVLFCDSEWRREWVGIYPDTPSPNGA